MLTYIGYVIVNISACISMISCGLYFYYYHTNVEIRNEYGAKKAYILLYFDTAMSLATLLPVTFYPSEDTLCNFQGFLFQFIPISESLWTALISVELYLSLRKQKEIKFSITKGLALVAIPGLVFGYLPLPFGEYSSSTFCGVNNIVLVLCTYYTIIWVVQIWNIIFLRLFLRKYRALNGEGTGDKDMRRRFKIYPLIIVVCFIPITVAKILASFGVNSDLGLYLGIFTFRLSGLINVILYGYTEKFKNEVFSRNRSESANVLMTDY